MLARCSVLAQEYASCQDLRQANEILFSEGSLELAISFFVKVDCAASQRNGRKKCQRRRAGLNAREYRSALNDRGQRCLFKHPGLVHLNMLYMKTASIEWLICSSVHRKN